MTKKTKRDVDKLEGYPLNWNQKKEVLKLRSVNNIVRAPAKTGRDKTKRKTVTKTDQINKLIWLKEIDTLRKFLTVHIKLIPPKIELKPAQCKLKITKSTL